MSIEGPGLTRFQALFVRVLRMRYNMYYKEIDEAFNKRYVGLSIDKPSRLRGRHLCRLSEIELL